MTNKDTLKERVGEIANQVQREFQMGGLADGIYLDFATEVALRFAEQTRKERDDEIVEMIKLRLQARMTDPLILKKDVQTYEDIINNINSNE